MNNCNISKTDCEDISKTSNNLKEFILKDMNLPDFSLFHILENCKKIDHLVLYNCNSNNWSSISFLKNLKFIDLNYSSNITSEDLDSILDGCPYLETIHLIGIKIINESHLNKIATLKSIASLVFTPNEGIKKIPESLKNRKIRIITTS